MLSIVVFCIRSICTFRSLHYLPKLLQHSFLCHSFGLVQLQTLLAQQSEAPQFNGDSMGILSNATSKTEGWLQLLYLYHEGTPYPKTDCSKYSLELFLP